MFNIKGNFTICKDQPLVNLFWCKHITKNIYDNRILRIYFKGCHVYWDFDTTKERDFVYDQLIIYLVEGNLEEC